MCMINRAGKLVICPNLLHYYSVVTAQFIHEKKKSKKTRLQGYTVYV